MPMFPWKFGFAGCTYNSTLAVSGNGAFTFTYDNGYLYVVDEGSAGATILKIYDMANPFGPVLVGTGATMAAQSWGKHPRVSGNYCYIPCVGNGVAANCRLSIWDVSNKAAPVEVGSVQIAYLNIPGSYNGPEMVAVIGSDAFCSLGPAAASAITLVKVDVSNPSSPSISAAADAGFQYAYPIHEFGSTIWIGGSTGSGGDACVRPFNTSLSPLAARQNFGSIFCSLQKFRFSTDGFMYGVVAGGKSLWTINANNPASPVNHGGVDMTQTGTTTSSLQAIEVCTELNRVYVGRGNGGGLCIPIMDITTRSAPVVSGSINTSGETVSDICRITDGCAGFAWGQGTGAAVHLLGAPPLS